MHDKKIMILGAGVGQIPLITMAQKQNIDIVLVSPPGEYPGLNLVENIYFKDVKNKKDILSIAQSEKIDAIVSDQIDVAVPTIAYVASKLKLRGIDPVCAKRFTDKYEMKKFASSCGINVVPSQKARYISEALEICKEFLYPVIIKPISSSASKGIYLVHDERELRTFFPLTKEQSNKKGILIEKYIQGEEYVVDGFVDNFENHNLIIGKSDNFDLKNLCISSTRIFKSISAPMNNVEHSILEMQDKIVKNFKPFFGNIHGEYFYDPHSLKIYLNEIAIRGGGCCTTTHIVPYLSHINTMELLFNNAICSKNTYNLENIKQGYCAYITCLLPEGEIIEVSNLKEILAIPETRDCYISEKLIGSYSKGMKDKGSKLGPIIVYSQEYKNLLAIIKKIKNTIIIKVKTPEGNIKSAIWK